MTNLYEEVFKKLNQYGVDYLVAGGVAVVLHGYPRFTADLDLMVDLERANLEKLIKVMKELGYKPKVPVKPESLLDPKERTRWIEEKNMQVFSFYHPKQHVALIDFFIQEPIEYQVLKKYSTKVKSGNLTIPLVSKEHLIELKKTAGRDKDLMDIKVLEEMIQWEKRKDRL